MKSKSRTSNIALYVILALLVAVNVLAVFGGSSRKSPPIPSTYSTHENGVKALYLLLQENGYDVRRLRNGYQDFPADAAALVVFKPSYPINVYEKDGLKSWLSRGGTLVSGLPYGEGLLDRLDFFESCCASPLSAVPLPGESIRVEEGAGILDGVDRLSPVRRTGLRGYPPETIPLITVDERVYMTVTKFGGGRIFVAPAESLFSNGNIMKHDNLRLAFNLFGELKSGPIYFDEFHHGYTSRGDSPVFSFTDAAFGTPYGLFVLLLVVAVLVLLLNRDGIRTEARTGQARRPSPLEFADAAADMYSRAKAYTENTVVILDIFHVEMARRSGLPPYSSMEDIAAGYPVHSTLHGGLMHLAALRRALDSGRRLSGAEALATAILVENLRKECDEENAKSYQGNS